MVNETASQLSVDHRGKGKERWIQGEKKIVKREAKRERELKVKHCKKECKNYVSFPSLNSLPLPSISGTGGEREGEREI